MSFVCKRLAVKSNISDSCNSGFVINTKNQAIDAIPITSITELNKNNTIKRGISFVVSSIERAFLDKRKILTIKRQS